MYSERSLPLPEAPCIRATARLRKISYKGMNFFWNIMRRRTFLFGCVAAEFFMHFIRACR